VAKRIVIIGGGAAGIGAAGAARGTDRDAEITVYTEYEDAAYSPCGIPYVHGGEIPDFERLFLGTKQQYAEQGIDIRYQTAVRAIDPRGKNVRVGNGPPVPYDALVIATGWDYGRPDVPGADLAGIYYMKNIREAMRWDEVLDGVRRAVVLEAQPLGMEMVTALCHRGIETHLVDPSPWALSMATDPDIVAPVQESWEEMGARLHFNTKLEAILGDEAGTGPRGRDLRRRDRRATWWSSAPTRSRAPTSAGRPVSRSARPVGSSSTRRWRRRSGRLGGR
jgi:NADH oxidase (H2O2-forming)